MYYYDIINQITFLITICLSLVIFSFVVFFNKDLSELKLSGISFFSPLILCVVSFLTINEAIASLLLTYSDILLFIGFVILLSLKAKESYRRLLNFSFYLIPIAFILLSYYFKAIPLLLSKTNIEIPVFLLLGIINLFFLRKEKGKGSWLFWGVLLLTLSMPVRFLIETSIFSYISILLKLSSYLIFFVYFYNQIYGNIMGQAIEADKKLNIINKSLNLEVKKRVFEIEQSNQKLVNISKTDALTKALNKKAIMDAVEELIATKPNSMFSIFMFDIDNFKTVNDTMGHIAGDKCIKKVANIGFNCIRDIDSLGRYGGDEFIVLLPGSTSIQAKIIAERFRKRVDETESPHFTVSVGIATFPADGTNVKDLISTADDGLYISKKKGKNSVSHKNLY